MLCPYERIVILFVPYLRMCARLYQDKYGAQLESRLRTFFISVRRWRVQILRCGGYFFFALQINGVTFAEMFVFFVVHSIIFSLCILAFSAPLRFIFYSNRRAFSTLPAQ
jgi:hypothetical protein